MNKMKKIKSQKRMNMYLDGALFDAIQRNAKANYLKPTTYVTQLLKIALLKNNDKSTNQNGNG
jgi:hypothetical protein